MPPKPKPLPPERPPIPSDQVSAVAGLDTASNRLHLYCDNGFHAHVPEIKSNPLQRRYQLHQRAKEIFEQLPAGTMLVIEEPLALKNGKTTRLLGMACGVIEAAAYDRDIYIYYADVSQWKLAMIGKGNADKEAIKLWVRLGLGLDFGDGEELADYYDAAALCAYGRKLLGRT